MIKLKRNDLPDQLKERLLDRIEKLHFAIAANETPPPSVLEFYRDPAVKAHLVAEAHGKCVYCESKITHVYFGDVEHLKPKALYRAEQLDIDNLALACAQCNNAKRDFWDPHTPLLNPYVDDPAEELVALGFIVARRPGRQRARITIEKLALNRPALVERRKERIELLENLADQYVLAPEGSLKELLRDELCRQAADDSEYAMIVRAYLNAACGIECVWAA